MRGPSPANIVDNGPFTIKELVAKDHVTLVPNPNWAGQKPALQEITIKFIDDLSAALRAFQTGELRHDAHQRDGRRRWPKATRR